MAIVHGLIDIPSLLEGIKEKNALMRDITDKLNGSTTPQERKSLEGARNCHYYDREKLLEYLANAAKSL